MGFFKSRHKSGDREDPVLAYEARIRELDDLLYGFALFFECVNLLYGEQEAVVETYRKQLRNIIQRGKQTSTRAAELLARARRHRKDASLLDQLDLSLGADCPDADPVLKRARILARLYEEIFPGRPRSQEFSEEEVLRLMEAAGEQFDSL